MTEKIAWQWISRFSTRCSTWCAFWTKNVREVNFLTNCTLCITFTKYFPVFIHHKIRQFHEISLHIICSNAWVKTFQYFTIRLLKFQCFDLWNFFYWQQFTEFPTTLHKQVFQHMKNSCISWWQLGCRLKSKWWQ